MRLLIVGTLFCALATVTSGCTRKSGETTAVRLSFANGANASHKMNSSAAMDSGSDGIDVVILNVTGQGIPQPIFYQWHARAGGDGTCLTLPCTVSLSVPKGDGRLIQAIVVKKTSTGSMKFYYNDVTVSLQGASADVEIAVEQLPLNSAGDSNLAGRYVNANGGGPTGKVQVLFSIPGHPEKPEMLIDQNSDMIGGWFRAFTLDGAAFHYRVTDGTELFGGPVGAASSSLVGGSGIHGSMRVVVPDYWVEKDMGTFEPNPGGRSIFGWFGPGAAGKQICWYNGVSGVDRAFADSSGAAQLQWNPGGAGAHIEDVQQGVGVVETDASGACAITGKTRFTDYISFRHEQLGSHDRVLGFQGPFQIQSSGDVMTTSMAAGTLTANLVFLPGAQTSALGKAVDGVDLFMREEPTSQWNDDDSADYRSNDGVACGKLTALARPFNFLTQRAAGSNLNMTITANALPTSLQTAYASGRATVIACPYTTASTGKMYFSAGAISHSSGGGGGVTATAIVLSGPQSPNPVRVAQDVCTPFRLEGSTGSGAGDFPPGAMANIVSDNADLVVYRAGSGSPCMYPADQVTGPFPVNGRSVDLYVMSTVSGSRQLTATVSGIGGTASLPVTVAAQPGTVNELVKINAPTSIAAWTCYPISAETWDATPGQEMIAGFATSYNFSWPAADIQYFDSYSGGCDGAVSTSFYVGSSSGVRWSGYFRYIGSGTTPISITPTSSDGYYTGAIAGGGSIAVTQPSAPVKFGFRMPSSIEDGKCVQGEVGPVDGKFNPSPVGGGVDLTVSGDASTQFYADSSCYSGATPSATIALGDTQTSGKFWFKSIGSGASNLILTASSAAPNLSGTMTLSLKPATATQIFSVLPGQTFTPGMPVSGSASPGAVGVATTVEFWAVKYDNTVDTAFNGVATGFSGSNYAFPASLPFVNGHAILNFTPQSWSFSIYGSVALSNGGTGYLSAYASNYAAAATTFKIYMDAPDALTPGACQIFAVIPEDAYGWGIPAANGQTVTLTANNGTIYTDNACSLPLGASFVSAQTTKMHVFWFKGNASSSGAITTQAAGYTNDTLSTTVGASGAVGASAQWKILGFQSPRTTEGGRCLPYLGYLADSAGLFAPPPGDVTNMRAMVGYGNDTTGAFTFLPDCSTNWIDSTDIVLDHTIGYVQWYGMPSANSATGYEYLKLQDGTSTYTSYQGILQRDH